MRLIHNKSEGRVPALPPLTTRWQTVAVASSYDQERFSSPAGRLFNYLSLRAIRRALRAIPDGPGRTLDIPCGTGRATAVALEFTKDVVGADVSSAMIEQARRRWGAVGSLPLELADITRQPFESESFDCVMSIRFMMHPDAETRRSALREMARVTRRYLVVEYGYISPWLRLRRKLKSAYRRLRGKNRVFVQALPWQQIEAEIRASDLKLVRSFHTARGLSESIILLLAKA